MAFWVFMVTMNLLNPIFGYRTSMSMKNQDTWEYAHRYCGRIWYGCGMILLPFSVIPMFAVLGKNDDIVGVLGGIICAIQILLLIGSIFPTEKALKKEFDETGGILQRK